MAAAAFFARFQAAQGNVYQAGIQTAEGKLLLAARMPLDLAAKQREINQALADYDRLSVDKKAYRLTYLLLLSLITLFILFFAIWIARYMAGQISTPITALLRAAEQIRKGNLSYRVRVGAIDELATLVRAFNEMTEALETNSRELEARRRFTEAILESIPTGVISLTSDGRIQRVNRALLGIFPGGPGGARVAFERLVLARRYRRDPVSDESRAAHRGGRYADRIQGGAARIAIGLDRRGAGRAAQFRLRTGGGRYQRTAARPESRGLARSSPASGARDQESADADRAVRRPYRAATGRPEQTPDTRRILQRMLSHHRPRSGMVKTLVDEFSQFTRFPAAHPVPSDLNQVVDNALSVFDGRLDGIRSREGSGGRASRP